MRDALRQLYGVAQRVVRQAQHRRQVAAAQAAQLLRQVRPPPGCRSRRAVLLLPHRSVSGGG